jgi:NADH-quinone oxidoreductase subunit E
MYGKDFERRLAGYEARFPADRKQAALLLALHAVQRERGFVDEQAKAWLAERYGLSVADVQGVISFYTMFFDEHPGQHVIWLCRTFSCQMMGGREVAAVFEEKLGCKMGERTADGELGLYWMECLAACDRAPCAQVDDEMYYDLTPESVDLLIDRVRAGGGGGAVVSGKGGKLGLEPAPRSARLHELEGA